jgi:hypothetical protein
MSCKFFEGSPLQCLLVCRVQRPDAVRLFQKLRTVEGRDFDRFGWCEASFYEQLDAALIAETSKVSAETRRSSACRWGPKQRG